MEPQHGAPAFFGDGVQPVAALDVHQLVRDHGALHGRRQIEHAARQQHDRAPHADGGRRSDLVGDGERGARRRVTRSVRRRSRRATAPGRRARRCARRRRKPRPSQSNRATIPAAIANRSHCATSTPRVGEGGDRRRRRDEGRRRLEQLTRGSVLRIGCKAAAADSPPRPPARSAARDAARAAAARRVAMSATVDQRGELDAVGGEVRDRQRHSPSLSSSVCSSLRSRSVRPFSFSRCTSSGRAEPSKTRLTNSRTIDWTTSCCGRTGA